MEAWGEGPCLLDEAELPVDIGIEAHEEQSRLPRLVGRTKALDLMITGRTVQPAEALELGIVDRLFPAERLQAETMKYATKVASGATLAVGRIKQALMEGMDLPLDEALALERDLMEPLFDTADATEGIAAFAEKRQPTYTGR